MKIVQLEEKEIFKDTCEKLAKNVLVDFRPQMIMGILTGGGYVGKHMISLFEKENLSPIYWEGRIQRKLTLKKDKSLIKMILRQLPRSITKVLILMEVKFLEWKSKRSITERSFDPEIFNEVKEVIISNSISSILVVDDCIDTGKTIKTILDQLKKNFPDGDIRTAVICDTHKKPLVKADYILFERTICRFPWSMEVRNNEK